MKLRAISILVLVPVLSLLAVAAHADSFGIGAAGVYGVMGYAGVTNTGNSVINGDVGGGAGSSSVTGFPPGSVNAPYTITTGSVTAFTNATTAYTDAQNGTAASALSLATVTESSSTLGAGGLGASMAAALTAGDYVFGASSVINLGGTLYLDAGGSSSANFIFDLPGSSSLVVNGGTNVVIFDAGSGTFTGSVTWAVAAGATFSGSPSDFVGTIISDAGDTLTNGDVIGCGRVISLDASVTLINDSISVPGTAGCSETTGASGGSAGTTGMVTGGTTGTVNAPEPGTFALLAVGLAGLLALCKVSAASSRPQIGV